MYQFIIGSETVFQSSDATAVVARSEAEGFHLVTEVAGAYALAHPDGRTGLVRIA
ncbi:gp07 [Rhodococcus phage ReqiPine5]|uniref:Gp07 n=1 Tax=Rhodococcus phage ReqiPine5 TaxID=691963 RepID=D4P7Y2_9CAUD|nr:gp07 [Rhodococcus phage ReqiPine5]ADD81112.1 gp07 [Rhodococcus phage ReqiPine5]